MPQVNAFPFTAGGYSTFNTQSETLPLGRCLQGTLRVVPVMVHEMLCVSVLLYWSSGSMCPISCQMVGVLGLESLVLAKQVRQLGLL